MACLTREQLAQLALGLAEGGRPPAHVDQCEACRAKLADVNQLASQLSAAHAQLDDAHVASRERLLDRLAQEKQPVRPVGMWRQAMLQLDRLTPRQRIAVGSIGLSTAALVLLMFVLFSSATRLSAMERIVRAVREVKSYSYQLSNTVERPPPGEHFIWWRLTISTYWLAPESSGDDAFGSLYSEHKSMVTRIEGDKPKPSIDLVTIFPDGKPGILIDHAAKTYYWTPALRADDIPENSPIAKLRAVRDGAGEVVRELGTRKIGGRQARGYVLAFHGAPPFRHFDEVEVWVDPKTDLPLEFSFQTQFEEGGHQRTDKYRITDCRWNIEIDPKLFDIALPEGYTDTTPPDRQEDAQQGIAEIVAALRLYAELGGYYPQGEEFDGHTVHDEMLKMAGFTGPPQPDWSNNATYQRIQHATAGLSRLARVLSDKYHTGYFGQEVGPDDKDQVLLWWTVDTDDLWRVFYGDLGTEVLSLHQWVELYPDEAWRLGVEPDGED